MTHVSSPSIKEYLHVFYACSGPYSVMQEDYNFGMYLRTLEVALGRPVKLVDINHQFDWAIVPTDEKKDI